MNITLVTGLPRSGTSMVTGVIRACGAFTGETDEGTEWNKKGNCENLMIREHLLKPYLASLPACTRGLVSLPNINHGPRQKPSQLRRGVQVFLRRQQYEDGPIVYKDAKIALVWRWFAQAFPEAKWVIVHRDPDDVIASVKRSEPMTRQFGSNKEIRHWAEAYQAHVASIDTNKITVQATDDLRSMIDWLGLEWSEEAVAKWVDWPLLSGESGKWV